MEQTVTRQETAALWTPPMAGDPCESFRCQSTATVVTDCGGGLALALCGAHGGGPKPCLLCTATLTADEAKSFDLCDDCAERVAEDEGLLAEACSNYAAGLGQMGRG